MAIPIVSFTAGGIDVESIVQGLMQVERQPINMLQTRQAKAQLQNDALSRLRSSLDSLKSMAASVVTNGVGKLSSTVSAPSAVTASLSPFARAGSVTFTVDQLARAHGLRISDDGRIELVRDHLRLDVRAVHQRGRGRHLLGAGRTGRRARQLHRVGAAGHGRRNPHWNIPGCRIDTDRRHQQHAQPRARRRGDSDHHRVRHVRRGRPPRRGAERDRRRRRRRHRGARCHRPSPPHDDPRGLCRHAPGDGRQRDRLAAASPWTAARPPASTDRSRSVPSPPRP